MDRLIFRVEINILPEPAVPDLGGQPEFWWMRFAYPPYKICCG